MEKIDTAASSHREAVDRFAELWWDDAPAPASFDAASVPPLSAGTTQLVIRAERV